MDRLCSALLPGKNSCRSGVNKDSEKNKESSIISEKIEKSLQDWKLPPTSASNVFRRSGIFNFTRDPTVKTVEKEIPLAEGYSSFPLLTDYLQRIHKGEAPDLYVGIIQVALKPRKLGSNASAIICLRDNRFSSKFHVCLLGMVESSLSDGPIYFSYFPTHPLCLSDSSLSSAFKLDIKIQGSSTMPGDRNIILMYRFLYKLNGKRKKLFPVYADGQTTLFLTNVARSNRVVSKKIYWDQISVPEKWMYENNFRSSSSAAAEHGTVARIDWKAVAEAYVVKVDVAGFKKEEVKVAVESKAGGILVISGEKSNDHEEKDDDEWHCVERSSGKFLRRFKLPENTKLDEVKAAVENGMLMITMPKGEVNNKSEVKEIHISG